MIILSTIMSLGTSFTGADSIPWAIISSVSLFSSSTTGILSIGSSEIAIVGSSVITSSDITSEASDTVSDVFSDVSS